MMLSANRSIRTREPRSERCPGAMRRGTLHWAATCSAVMLLVAHAVAGADNTSWTVDDIRFDGNETLSREQLLAVMVTEPRELWTSHPFERELLNKDLNALRRLYREYGFPNPRVSVAAIYRDLEEHSVDIVVRIREGPRTVIGSVAYQWNELVTDEQLAEVAESEAGDPFVIDELQADAQALEQYLAERGLLMADVGVLHTLTDDRDTALVTFLVEEGPLVVAGDIDIRELDAVKRGVVLRELTFEPGDTLTLDDLRESQRRLAATGLFENIILDIEDTTGLVEPGAVRVLPVTIRLDERDMFRYYLSASFAPFDLLRLTGAVRYVDLFRLGHSIGLTGHVSATLLSAELTYTTQVLPWAPVWVSMSGFILRRDEETFEGVFGGGRLAFNAQPGPFASYWLRFEGEWTATVDAPESETVLPETENESTFKTALGFSYDQRAARVFPILGARAKGQTEIAGAGGIGTNRFLRLWADLRGYAPLFGLPIGLVSGINGGLITDFIPDSERLPAQELFGIAEGPIREVRGYDRDEIGPTNDMGQVVGGRAALVFTVLEIRIPLYKEYVQAVVFSDAGQVWRDPDDVDLEELQWSIGPGLRINIAGTLIGVDYGFQLGEDGEGRLHFSAESQLTAVR
ncbi:MAG: BamA/TamA family outer membrane protein [Chitinivibrionales bacterium]|nr:BamA/TamA family outer membrane protein [Chitinivibrionales bacterium]